MNDYASRIPDREDRENAARLYEALAAAEEALDEAYISVGQSAEHAKAREDLAAAYEAKKKELSDWYFAESRKLEGSFADLQSTVDAARAAYEGSPGYAVDAVFGKVSRCAVSNVPLWEGDNLIEINGKSVLMELFVPADVVAMLEADDDDDASGEEADVEIVGAAE